MSGEDKDLKELERILDELNLESDRITRKQKEIKHDIAKLKHSVKNKRNSVIKGRTTAGGATTATSANTKEPGQSKSVEVVRDRIGNPLNVGDRVYICTKGAFKSRRGVLKYVTQPPDHCIILDEDGVGQGRISRNLLLETVDTLKYLH